MRTIETHLTVKENRKAIIDIDLPEDIGLGEYKALVIIDDVSVKKKVQKPIEFSKFTIGLKDPACTFRREDMYGDNGR